MSRVLLLELNASLEVLGNGQLCIDVIIIAAFSLLVNSYILVDLAEYKMLFLEHDYYS